jgi:hypothetical protein
MGLHPVTWSQATSPKKYKSNRCKIERAMQTHRRKPLLTQPITVYKGEAQKGTGRFGPSHQMGWICLSMY